MSAALAYLGWYEEAEKGHRKAVQVHRRLPELEYTNTMWSLRGLVRALAAQNKLEEARPFAEDLLKARRRVAQRPNPSAYQLNCYARELLTIEPADLRDPELGLEIALRAYAITGDEYHYNSYTTALAYEATGQLDKAIEMAQRALAHAPIEESTERREYEAALARFLEDAGKVEEAEQVYLDTLEARRAQFPSGHLDIAGSLFDLGQWLLTQRKPVEAEKPLRECLAIREAALDREDLHLETIQCRIAQAKSALGASLTGQAKFAEAEILLLESYQRLNDIPLSPRHSYYDTLERMVHLYESWGKYDQAAPYRDQVASAPVTRTAPGPGS